MLMKKCTQCKQYTLSDKCPACEGEAISAHPARFQPLDKFSEERIIFKRRNGLLLTQKQEN